MRLFLTCCLLLLAACSKEPLHQSKSYVFGTLVDISIYGEDEQRSAALADHILQDFQFLHRRLHAWQEGSALSDLNQAFASGKSVPINDDLAVIIKDATQWSIKSGGSFNPAIGRLIQYWGFQRDEFTPVEIDPEKIEALVATAPQMTDIVIRNRQASSKNAAVRLDLGGYAKGYALDRAAHYLRSQNVKNALINIGGNIIALGRHGAHAWKVGIQHPRQPGPIATLELEDGWAIGTSGDYQRYFEKDGRRYCHLIDPSIGYPAQSAQSVTVLVPPANNSGLVSDVASKPIFLAASGDWAQQAHRMGIAHVMLVDAKGRVFASSEMAAKLHWADQNGDWQKLF